MDVSSIIFLGILAALVMYAVTLYNNLVSLKHSVSKAWSNIDVLLKQRHDELPKLVETCKQYMGFEQETLEKVMQARSAVSAARERGDVSSLGPAESQLRMGLGNLFAVAEAYPELKANETFKHLQGRISVSKMLSQTDVNFTMNPSMPIMSALNNFRMSFLPACWAFQHGTYSSLLMKRNKTSM